MPNIKVSDDVYQRLKEGADANFRTIGGQIDYLMSLEIGGTPKIPEAKTPQVDDLFKEPPKKIISEPMAQEFPKYGEELPCCLNDTVPCKHWVWDTATGDGYKNVISGRFMEVE